MKTHTPSPQPRSRGPDRRDILAGSLGLALSPVLATLAQVQPAASEDASMPIHLDTIDSIAFPARDLDLGIATWTDLLGQEPAYATDDFAMFQAGEVGISLTRLPWVDHPLVFWRVGDVAEAHAALVSMGATPMVEVEGGVLAELGTAPASAGNQDPATGIIDVGVSLLAVLKARDGSLVALSQPVGG